MKKLLLFILLLPPLILAMEKDPNLDEMAKALYEKTQQKKDAVTKIAGIKLFLQMPQTNKEYLLKVLQRPHLAEILESALEIAKTNSTEFNAGSDTPIDPKHPYQTLQPLLVIAYSAQNNAAVEVLLKHNAAKYNNIWLHMLEPITEGPLIATNLLMNKILTFTQLNPDSIQLKPNYWLREKFRNKELIPKFVTPLLWSCINSRYDYARLLIQHGADLYKKVGDLSTYEIIEQETRAKKTFEFPTWGFKTLIEFAQEQKKSKK